MGLLDRSDWKAEWIGFDRPRDAVPAADGPEHRPPQAGPAAAVVPAHRRSRCRSPSAAPPCTATALGIFDLSPQRPARQRRLLQPRLDRLHQAGLLPGLRRDRPGPARATTPWARSWPTAGTAATSASARSATITASSPRLRAQLAPRATPTARTQDVATGPDWKAATGPILEADFLMGETYDARQGDARLGLAGLRRRRLAARRSSAPS